MERVEVINVYEKEIFLGQEVKVEKLVDLKVDNLVVWIVYYNDYLRCLEKDSFKLLRAYASSMPLWVCDNKIN